MITRVYMKWSTQSRFKMTFKAIRFVFFFFPFSFHQGLQKVIHPVKVQDDLELSSCFFICIFCICFLFLITRVHMNLSTKSRFKTICRTMTAAKRKVQTFMPWYNLGSGSEKQARKHPVTVTRLTNQTTWKIGLFKSNVDDKD